MKIVITDRIDLPEKYWNKIKELGDVKIYNDIPNEQEIINRIHAAQIITATWIDITENILQTAINLQYIIVPAVGFEWVDINAANKKGVKVINCPTQNTWAVAEHAIGLMFIIARKMIEANNSLRSGKWQPEIYKGIELRNKKLGIIGYGKIGQKVARLASGLMMNVHYANSKTPQKELDQLLTESDFICLNVPLNEHTKHIIDKRKMGLMKRTAFLINVSRGAVIDQKALITALKNQQIAGAALDVFENEPLTGQPNKEIVELAKLPNVVATPHIAYNTEESANRLGEELIANLKGCLNNKPINVVN